MSSFFSLSLLAVIVAALLDIVANLLLAKSQGFRRKFIGLGKLKNLAPATPEVQNAIRKLQQFITDHFYTCTPEILAGLGEMYVADERFRENIDKAGGAGTATFVSKAIAVYCGR